MADNDKSPGGLERTGTERQMEKDSENYQPPDLAVKRRNQFNQRMRSMAVVESEGDNMMQTGLQKKKTNTATENDTQEQVEDATGTPSPSKYDRVTR